MKKYAMLADVYYCTGCHSCEVACQQENDLDAGMYGVKITEHILNQKQGLMIDYVPYFTDLCNGCASRIATGRRTNCEKACLAQCLKFGPADEIMEEAKKAKKPIVFFK